MLTEEPHLIGGDLLEHLAMIHLKMANGILVDFRAGRLLCHLLYEIRGDLDIAIGKRKEDRRRCPRDGSFL
jgi:hypothetical protein